MELVLLEDFLILSATGNFSRAAELRNVSQPAFSRRIRNLEYWVGATLIDRNVYPVALTAAGASFRIAAEGIVNNFRLAREEAQMLSTRTTDVVTFASLHTLAVHHFPAWFADLQLRAGQINARVLAADLAACVENLISGTTDFMLSYSNAAVSTSLHPDRYPSVLLREERFLPVCVATEDGTPRFSLEKDKAVPHLRYPQDSFLGRLAEPIIRHNDLSKVLNPVYENSMAVALKPLVLSGNGVAWLPESIIENELNSGLLVHAGAEQHTRSLTINLYRSAATKRDIVERVWSQISTNSAAVR